MLSKDKHIVAIIPARGASKRLAKKNLVPLVGRPLITYTIAQARAARRVDRVIVSTEDNEIAKVAKQSGAEVFIRPLELAADNATSESALLHILDEIKKRGEQEPDLVVFLQCTSPVRRPDDIDRAIATLEDEQADSLFSATRNFALIWSQNEKGLHSLNYDYHTRAREQDMDIQYQENGSIYVFKPKVLRAYNNRLGGKIAVYEMDMWHSFQIDSPDDVEFITYIMEHKK